jgi:hypothetical protein
VLKAIATTCRKHLSSKQIYLSRKQLSNHSKFPSEAQITAEAGKTVKVFSTSPPQKNSKNKLRLIQLLNWLTISK